MPAFVVKLNMMKKPLVIGLWSVAFLGLFCLGLCFVGDAVSNNPVGSWEICVADFNKRVKLYASDPTKPVVVGSSYVVFLREIPDMHNLGLISARPAEIDFIVRRYCQPDQRIFYLLTLREWWKMPSPFRHELRGRLLQNIIFARSAMRRITRIPKPKWTSNFVEQSAHVDIDIGYLVRLQKDFPNIVFVLSPTRPLSQSDATERRAAAKERELRVAMSNAGLTAYDLSSVLPSGFFTDYLHLTGPGNKILRSKLTEVAEHPMEMLTSASTLVSPRQPLL